jgi:hypothetical protein
MSKKATTPKQDVPILNEKEPLRTVSTTEMLLNLAVAQDATPRLWPCLVGPTGSGKTARVRQLAESLKLPLVSPPLTQGLPEDFSGLPRVTASGYSWHLPPWALKAMAEPCVVFFDEIDKASEDHQKILLPVLHELEIHGRSLHPDTVMVCAMQAPTEAWRNTETGAALMARVVPLIVVSDSDYLTRKYNIDLSGLKWAEYPINLDRSPTMRGLDWLFTYMGREPRPEYHLTVAKALFGETIGTMLVERHNNRVLTSANLCKLIRSEPTTVSRLSIAELVALGADAMFILDCTAYAEMRVKILTEGSEEDDIQFTVAQFDEKERRQGPNQQPIEIFPGCEEPEVVEMINTIATRVGEVWKTREKTAKHDAI